MMVAPLLVTISGSITVLIQTKLGSAFASFNIDASSSFLLKFFLKLMSFGLLFSMFTFIYMVLPNTKVKFSSATKAALISAILFEILQWVYLAFQIGVSNYNAIYGSFAALPLFLFWIQSSWFVVLLDQNLLLLTKM